MTNDNQIFTKTDFEGMQDSDGMIHIIDACDLSNRKINKLIESWPKVVGLKTVKDNWIFAENYCSLGVDTHQARLAFIEPIKPQ